MAASAARKPGYLNYFAWGSGDMLGAGAQAVISGWLIYFFVTFCDLTAVQAGLIAGLPRLLEAITCPLLGYVSDNLRHTWIGRKIGRRKIFLLITLPLLPAFALIYVAGQSFYYYLATFVFFDILYTTFLIPWETLAAEMSRDYTEKAKFAGIRILIAQTSAVLASYLPTIIINHLGGKDQPVTFLIMGAIFGGIFSLVVLLVLLFTWERPYTEAEKLIRPKPLDWKAVAMVPVNMFRDLFSTLRIRAFRQHLSLYLGGYISQDIFNTAFPIFVVTVMMGATLIISQLMTVMYIAQVISVAAAINVIIRVGAVLAYRIAICLVGVSLLLFLSFYYLHPPGFQEALAGLHGNIFSAFGGGSPAGLIFWLFVPIALSGLGRGTLNFVPWSVYNYLPDVDEAVTGQRREGIFAGVMTMVRKTVQSGATIVTASIIGAGGYISGKDAAGNPLPQTPEAIRAIVWLLAAGPILVMLLGLIASWRFKLNAKSHAVLMHEIERLRGGATEPESPESRGIVEGLTGWKFEKLWGRNTVGSVRAAVAEMPPTLDP